jgi:hypothetical protein
MLLPIIRENNNSLFSNIFNELDWITEPSNYRVQPFLGVLPLDLEECEGEYKVD